MGIDEGLSSVRGGAQREEPERTVLGPIVHAEHCSFGNDFKQILLSVQRECGKGDFC